MYSVPTSLSDCLLLVYVHACTCMHAHIHTGSYMHAHIRMYIINRCYTIHIQSYLHS